MAITAGSGSTWARETLALLGRVHPSWSHRPGQDTMADAIDQAIRDRATLLIDAPPGWGKSLAALVPIAARDGEESLRAAYCTGTIALQEQLIGKDVPLVQRAFGRPDAALLKGFSHYLCRVKSDRWATEMFDRGGAAVDPAAIQAFVRWMAETAEGDEAELVPRPSWRPRRQRPHRFPPAAVRPPPASCCRPSRDPRCCRRSVPWRWVHRGARKSR